MKIRKRVASAPRCISACLVLLLGAGCMQHPQHMFKNAGSSPFTIEALAGDEEIPDNMDELLRQLQQEVDAYYTIQDIIFYGDSRVVGMTGVGGDGYHYLGRTSAGYRWMTGKGLDYLKSTMADYPEAAVVFCFGVNDLGNVERYISWYQSFLETYPERPVYFLSVNPVVEDQAQANGYNVYDNDLIETFNRRLEEEFPERYLNCFDHLTYEGIGTGDGVHYSYQTYWDIQEYVREEIQERMENAEEADEVKNE